MTMGQLLRIIQGSETSRCLVARFQLGTFIPCWLPVLFIYAFLTVFAVAPCLAVEENPAVELLVYESRYDNGAVHRRYTYYIDENGREVQHGKETWYDDDGDIRATREFVHDKETGMQKGSDRSGREDAEGRYADGKPTGVLTRRRPDGGILSEASDEEGNSQKNITQYWPGGKKRLETTYDTKSKRGEVMGWHENDQILVHGHYLMLWKHGKWTGWDENGSVVAESYWVFGLPWSGVYEVPAQGELGSLGGMVEYRRAYLREITITSLAVLLILAYRLWKRRRGKTSPIPKEPIP